MRAKVLGLALILAALLGAPWGAALHATARADSVPPSVVVILTDDQRWDTLSVMPNVQALLVDQGVTFSNAFVSESLCCPSRASLLTGQYAHSTGVYRNEPPYGGFPSFDDSSTLATWLDPSYTTGLFGKYLNDYEAAAQTGYIPPGWDQWSAFLKPSYYDYNLNTNGSVVPYGNATSDYSTTQIGSQAANFVRQTSGPLFLYYAPFGPHGPATPATEDQNSFSNLLPWRPPSYNEKDVSDKPAYIRQLDTMDRTRRNAIDGLRRRQLQSLQSVDRAVAQIVGALSDTGRLANTMIIFTSDNGFSWGEHRWIAKRVPYDESIRVPLVIRYDPLTSSPSTNENVVANIDIAPTVAELAGVAADAPEGQSLMPLLSGGGGPWRPALLLEYLHKPADARGLPTFCGVRTPTAMFTRYRTGESELYDLSTDPYEMSNVAGNPAYAALRADMESKMAALCQPPPPGY